MKLLKDKYFEGVEALELNSKVDFDLEIFFDEIRDVVSQIFTEYNSLKEDGELDVELKYKINLYIENIKDKYENQFIKNIWFSGLYEDKLFLCSRFYDESLSKNIDKDSISEGEQKAYNAIANKFYGGDGTMISAYDPEPWDIWRFSNFEELENGFIDSYDKLKKVSLPKEEELKIKDFYKKFHFKYSKNTQTYLKPIYIKGSFNNELENAGDFLAVSIRKKLKNLIKDKKSTVKDFDFTTPSKSNIEIYEKSQVVIDPRYDIILQNGEKIGVIIIDDTIITLSIDKNNTPEAIYDFLEELYFHTKKELIEDVKGGVENILMNFSSEESNIINQYNYLASQIGLLDFKKKKELTKEINLEEKTFIYGYNGKSRTQSRGGRIVDFTPKEADLMELGINRKENKIYRNEINSKY